MAAEATHIIGVVQDFAFEHPLAAIDPMVFPVVASAGGGVMLVQSPLPVEALQKSFREVVMELQISLIGGPVPMTSVRADLLAPDRARAVLTIGAAALVVLVAAFGFYGTQRYLVAAGMREYAVRASLGAGPAALGRLVLLRAAGLGLPGLVLGAPLAIIVVAWLRDDYVSREVPAVGVTAVLLLGLLALVLLASLGPARIARHVQPAALLREE